MHTPQDQVLVRGEILHFATKTVANRSWSCNASICGVRSDIDTEINQRSTEHYIYIYIIYAKELEQATSYVAICKSTSCTKNWSCDMCLVCQKFSTGPCFRLKALLHCSNSGRVYALSHCQWCNGLAIFQTSAALWWCTSGCCDNSTKWLSSFPGRTGKIWVKLSSTGKNLYNSL